MNYFNKEINKIGILFAMAGVLLSCDFEYELPEAGSIPDNTPPEANFEVSQSTENFLTFNFSNQSRSATKYKWDFGDGNTSENADGINTYPEEGSYTVTLEASDNLGEASVFSQTVEVVEPEAPEAIIPPILEAGFEDNTLPDGTGDGRDSWRISGGKIFGVTSSPVRTGSQGAKFDAGDPRVAYQALTVTPNTDYILTIYYTMKTSPGGGEIRLAVLGNAIDDASEAEDTIIASVTGNNQDAASEFVPLTLVFNSGATDTIAIWMDSNNVAEARVDDVSITLGE